MRTFAVGDIHGHRAKLEALLPKLRDRAEPGDALVFVGDYVDRGPDSRGVIDLVLSLVRGDWDGLVTSLRGNHEILMLDTIAGNPQFEPEVWLRNGGKQTISSYTGGVFTPEWAVTVPDEHMEFLLNLEPWHPDANGIYVHAGLRPGRPPEDCDEEALFWIREEFIESDYEWDRVVVFGHTPQYEPHEHAITDLSQLHWRPLVRPEKIGIDTGVAYGGPLTAVVLPEREFVSAR